MTRGEWIAVSIAVLAALWSTLGNWFVVRWTKRSDHVGEDVRANIIRDQKLLQLESDHSAHKQNDDLRFGFIQQSLTRLEGYVADIRVDIGEIRKEKNHER